MRAGLRFGIAAIAPIAVALALAAAPALAQNTPAPASNTPSETIGPRELEDFSINGTVTRPAPTTPSRTAPAPRPTPPATTRAPATAPARATPPGPTVRDSAPRTPSQTAAQPDPLSSPPTPAPSDFGPPVDAQPQPGFAPAPAPVEDISDNQQGNYLPWLLALLLLAGGVGLYAWRQRSRPSYATASGLADALVQAEPAPAPKPVQRAPSPQPTSPSPSEGIVSTRLRPAAPSAPPGIVSTRLRPWLEIEFTPGRCVVENDTATIQFDVAVFNSGGAPARDVLVEASMFNAGPTQDEEIGAFFAHPVAEGDRIPAIPPLKRIALKSAVTLAGDQLRQFEVAGKRIFVPLVGFNALYRWSGGEGQTSASYLVGRDNQGERMAPLRLDLGPRVFRGLGAREHSVSVRK
jgi:hypothetical protein